MSYINLPCPVRHNWGHTEDMRPCSVRLLVWTRRSLHYGCSACPIDPSTRRLGCSRLTWSVSRRCAGRAAGWWCSSEASRFLRSDCCVSRRGRGGRLRPGIITTEASCTRRAWSGCAVRLAYCGSQLFGFGRGADRATQAPGLSSRHLPHCRAWVAEAGRNATSTWRCPPVSAARDDPAEVGSSPGRSPTGGADRAAIDPGRRRRVGGHGSLRRAVAALAHCKPTDRPLLAWKAFRKPRPPLPV